MPLQFIQSHIRRVHACLFVTCQLHFLQKERDLLCATAVTRGWNGYRWINEMLVSMLWYIQLLWRACDCVCVCVHIIMKSVCGCVVCLPALWVCLCCIFMCVFASVIYAKHIIITLIQFQSVGCYRSHQSEWMSWMWCYRLSWIWVTVCQWDITDHHQFEWLSVSGMLQIIISLNECLSVGCYRSSSI